VIVVDTKVDKVTKIVSHVANGRAIGITSDNREWKQYLEGK